MSRSSPMQKDSREDDVEDFALGNLQRPSTVVRSDDDEEDDGYVPESLACFVQAFDTALEEAKQNFLEIATTPKVLRQEDSPPHHSTILDDSDLKATPLTNPANNFTASGAKRELQIETNPRSKRNVAEQLVARQVNDSPSGFFPNDRNTGDLSRGAVLSSGDINDKLSPIAAVLSPVSVSSPHAARQKLFHSPGSGKLHTPDRAKSIRETVEMVSLQPDSKKTANIDTAVATQGETSSSPSRLLAGTSASKRRTQFIKARKAIATKKAGGRQNVADDRTDQSENGLNSTKTSVPSPASRLMKGTTASRAKRQDDADSMNPTVKRSTVGQPMANTMLDSLSVATHHVPVSKRAVPSSHAGPKQTMNNREKENHTSAQSNRTKKLTLDERIAAARERARLRNLEKEALLVARLASKSKISTSMPAQVLEVGRIKRPAPKTAPVNLKTRPEKQKITIPQSPKFATNNKLGVRKPLPSISMEASLAQSTDVLRKGLRSQEPIGARVKRAGLTVPKTPRFATDTRLKQRFYTPASNAGIMTLAQSNDMHRRGLRTMTAPVSKRPNGLTVPKSPKFQTTTKRSLPKSTAEKEAEIMSYYKSHPFKAAPIMKEIPQEKPKAKLRPRQLTNPAPFKLRTDSRCTAAAHHPAVMEKQDDEVQFKFHARPMPNYSRRATTVVSQKSLTKPIPFNLSSSPKENISDESETVKEARFRAKPIPKTTYEYHPPPKTPPRTTICSKSPDLATAKRSMKHEAVIQISRARAEALSAEKEAMHKARQREQLKEALEKADLLTPRSAAKFENIKPFELQSTQRHENYVKEMEEKKRQEDEERLKQMEFHARSFHPSPVPTPIQSPRNPTQPEPFNVSGMASVEAEKEAARKKLLQKEEERKAKAQISPFKARPVPSTTYVSPSSLASKSLPKVWSAASRTPSHEPPSNNEVAGTSHDVSPLSSESSNSRDANEDEIEIEFMECHSPEGEIGQFLAT